MNKTSCIISLLIAVFLVSCGSTQQSAIDLNDTIVADQKQIMDKEDKLIATFNAGSDRKTVEAAHKDMLNLLNSLEKKYADMEPFDDSDTFRKAMIELISTHKSITEKEFREMIDIYFGEYNEEANRKWKNLAKMVNDKAGSANDKWLTAQEEFAKQYKFEIQLEQ